MNHHEELAAAEAQYQELTAKARTLPYGSTDEISAWTLARHASMIIGQLRRQQ